ncbi:hypothetical protein LEP1GSC188_0366 [Leptospira weilii serovar Topaz str. LT2116]|uniref:Uncharacterized protein n=1 Tax=Leptospira weilii serovar Topaz str. LT2116 TaxID=1088540 RepID=M3ETC4_9LEPT|nr:hypothetical protein LEP1GSC188_0366 [Leptospira weilii serovar Topaz str. LT2116]
MLTVRGKSIAIFFTASSFSSWIRFLGFDLRLPRSLRASSSPFSYNS